jgi:DNA-binding transcriptional LysR family regulator
MDRLESMSTLLAAIEAGSLSAASRKLGMPLATVSRKVSELEAHLRTRLVNRTSRRLMLTDAGRSYAAACKRILEDIAEAERAASGEFSAPKGELAITAPIVFGRLHVLPVVTDFLKAYTEIDIRLLLADRVINLQEEDTGLAIRIGELPDSSLVAARIRSIRLVVCGSPAYFALRGRPESPRDLASHDCVTFDGLAAPEVWKFAAGKATLPVAVHSRLIVNTAEAAIDAAIAGAGVTRVLSYQAGSALHAGTLALVLEKFEPPPWPVSLV